MQNKVFLFEQKGATLVPRLVGGATNPNRNESNVSPIHIGWNGSVVIITNAHESVHRGKHFYVTDYYIIDPLSTASLSLTTPADSAYHVLYGYQCSQEAKLELYEDAEIVSGSGTPQTIFNSNRQSSIETSASAEINPTVNATGTVISRALFGSEGGKKTDLSSTMKRENELVLKDDTTYLFRVYNNDDTNNNVISFDLSWYENGDL